ncbi:MAG TPA: hypothetical protein VMU94_03040 [Streptosporangiaceae bacterium]|nr:hypothetical protein [Streptosporangiaceae bacterium]
MPRASSAPASSVDDAFEDFVRGRSTHLFRLALVLTGWDKPAAPASDLIDAVRRRHRQRLVKVIAASAATAVALVAIVVSLAARQAQHAQSAPVTKSTTSASPKRQPSSRAAAGSCLRTAEP